jgi:protein-S-isoprenylcysteine O-methyltransferase
MLLTVLLVSELFLMRRRLSGDRERAADRGSLRLLLIVIFASVCAAWCVARIVPQAKLASLLQLDASAMARLHWIGLGIFLVGLALRWLAIAWLGRLFTFDVAIVPDHDVIDTGPYRLVRHPAYTGSLLSFVGIGICGGNVLSLLVLVAPIALAFLHRIRIEETALVSALGARYVDYAGRTKRLIPFLY